MKKVEPSCSAITVNFTCPGVGRDQGVLCRSAKLVLCRERLYNSVGIVADVIVLARRREVNARVTWVMVIVAIVGALGELTGKLCRIRTGPEYRFHNNLLLSDLTSPGRPLLRTTWWIADSRRRRVAVM